MPHPPRLITHPDTGETLTIARWAKRLGCSPTTLATRIDRLKWPLAKALGTRGEKKFRPGSRRVADLAAVPALKTRKDGQAYARLPGGRIKYFGVAGGERAREKYRRFVAEWQARLTAPAEFRPGTALRVTDVGLAYLRHAEGHYVKRGKPTTEVSCIKVALRVLNRLYGQLPAAELASPHLQAVAGEMVRLGFVRDSIGRHLWRISRMYEWAAGNGLVPDGVHGPLAAAAKLARPRRGTGLVREGRKVPPAPEAAVAKVLEVVGEPWATMVWLQLVSGMRPGEACALNLADLDRTRSEWHYQVSPDWNKNEHKGKPQDYWLGPIAQELLAPWVARAEAALQGGTGRGFLFRSPRGRRPFVSRDYYCEVVRLACQAAGVAEWYPHQLRHSRATEVRALYGKEAAAAAIGDTFQMADTYAERDEAQRRRVARETG